MNSLLNFSKHFAIPAVFVLAINFNANAQSPVESTHIDEKYAYTTVVYKTAAATDKDVLTSLEKDFGIGDVVRVTFAPPPAAISAVAASEPVYADKNKGEDTWLPETVKSKANLTASTKPMVVPNTVVNTISVAPKPVPVSAKEAAPKLNTSTKTVVPEAPKQVKTVEMVSQTAAAPVKTHSDNIVKAKASTTGKTTKAHKSAKKAGKKSSFKKLKNRKHGKQRYACPTF